MNHQTRPSLNTVTSGRLHGVGRRLCGLRPGGVVGSFDVPLDVLAFDDSGVGSWAPGGVEPGEESAPEGQPDPMQTVLTLTPPIPPTDTPATSSPPTTRTTPTPINRRDAQHGVADGADRVAAGLSRREARWVLPGAGGGAGPGR
jgi:hypothetical protein